MDKHALLSNYIQSYPERVGIVVDYNPQTDRLFQFDFSASNTELSPEDILDTQRFSAWVNSKLSENNCRYGIGGYMEHRTLYARSELFNTEDEPRRLHLGVDIWADAGTPVYAPLKGIVHSFQNNNNFGDYGPTIILQHDLDGLTLYTLYGHLNRESIVELTVGKPIAKDEQIAVFGNQEVNGHWPPHLHFQLMFDMEGKRGDYPGVGYYSERENYLQNIPDPNLILRFE
ncbi:peptidoglycan DD-metalloendopeptidase family protein [Mucilaginibacter sp. BT774]|uniref:peptidoglycan DD-metalloendopeptidase family protein n=1 Tax=Mucilaginibacter sp. BT774 TaxID=3062276 RepID=UPI00267554E7|nr:peptidoglycan DD-metalloendopeptidase family protein [Mucilaginibacter sp. BT774]MDO3626585.1 peptidoglycan DD-metalloendopeptidase family protein [Mucilaginibacter sp. BT774]